MQPRPRRLVSYWAPPVAVLAVIALLPLWKGQPSGILLVPHMDKAVHFLLFGLLGLTLFRAFRSDGGWSLWRCAVATVVAVTGVGILDEIRQAFLPQQFQKEDMPVGYRSQIRAF